MLNQQTLIFLQELAQNNNRDWFTTHKKRYDQTRVVFEVFIDQCLQEILQFETWHNTKAKDCIFRINRDIRFSADKSPYKLFYSAAFGNGGRHSGKIDYYLHIQPNNQSFIGAGIYNTTSEQLAKFRQEIDYNPDLIKGIIEEKTFQEYFPEIWGEKLKKPPKGYTADHPDIELLCRKQLFFMHRFSDEQIQQANFYQEVAHACRIVKPYVDFVNELFYGEE